MNIMTPEELSEVRRTVRDELANVEQMRRGHGTYRWVCECGGIVMLTHRPVGKVICSCGD